MRLPIFYEGELLKGVSWEALLSLTRGGNNHFIMSLSIRTLSRLPTNCFSSSTQFSSIQRFSIFFCIISGFALYDH